MHRFKIVFNNSQHYNNLGNNSPLSRQPNLIVSRNRNISLNSPMIDRIHKAKPGCSACGKKVV
jgi:hypothetical protein